jgi:hypothetical protein
MNLRKREFLEYAHKYGLGAINDIVYEPLKKAFKTRERRLEGCVRNCLQLNWRHLP